MQTRRPLVVHRTPPLPIALPVVEVEPSTHGPIVVLDTNVVLSALFARPGQCSAILRRSASGEFRLVSSQKLWDEARHVLTSTYELDRADADTWLRIVSAPMETLTGTVPRVRIGGRPLSDGARRVLDAAVAAHASYLVTGDPELLKLTLVQGVEILSPSAFLALHGE